MRINSLKYSPKSGAVIIKKKISMDSAIKLTREMRLKNLSIFKNLWLKSVKNRRVPKIKNVFIISIISWEEVKYPWQENIQAFKNKINNTYKRIINV